jgi:hypothetical protein
MSDFDKVRLLLRKDMELEVQLENITNKAIKPKISNNAPPPVISKKTKEPIFRNTPQAIGDLELRDMAYEIELENITNKQVDAAPDVKPSVVKSVVTKEMIEDYQIEQTNPVKIGNQYFRYTPSSLTIDLEVPILVDVPIPKEDISNMLIEAEEQYTKNVKQIEYDQKQNIAQRQAVIDKFNTDDSQLKTMLSMKRQPKGGPKKPELFKRQQALAQKFQEDLQKIDDEYLMMTDALNAEETAYKIFVGKCKNSLEDHKNNEDEMRRVNSINQYKLKEYAGDLSILNKQFGNIQQGPNESDEEFKNRLESLVVPISDDQKIEAEGRLDFVQAKRNLKQFFTDGARVEVLVKKISPEDRSSFNKLFTKIKTDYLAKYGVDNKRISDEELVNYITEAIKQPNFTAPAPSPTAAAPAALTAPVAVEAVEAVIAPQEPAFKELKRYANSQGVSTIGSPKILELIGRMNQRDIYVPLNIIDRLTRESDKQMAINSNLDIDQRKTGTYIGQPIPLPPIGQPQVVILPKPPPPPKTGNGIGIKEYLKLMRFGKVCISPDDLYYKNILRIRLHNKRSILGLPDIRVSDSLSTIIMKIVDGNRVSKSDLSVLSKKDKMIYDKLMMVSGLHKTVDNSFNESAEEMKQRLRLIEGEIGAGQNNPIVLKEAHQLLHSMHACGMISNKAATKHYRHLKSFIE